MNEHNEQCYKYGCDFVQVNKYYKKCNYCGMAQPICGTATIVTPTVPSIPIPTLESILYSQLPAPEKINKIISLIEASK